ncbi:hypothetical protein L313_0463 [Acinetobacter haemolyticus CIP 64.3 = MTCC 9819]|nr:hypothetical protein L313_0463 [Acinetobacter haemolyticus CIP 64.3 = MTCC 9819]
MSFKVIVLSYHDFILCKKPSLKAWFFYMRELAMLKNYA